MAGMVGTGISGAKAIQAKLEAYGKKIEQGVADGVNETAINIHSIAVQLCPVDEGHLQNSIAIRKTAAAGDPTAEVSTNMEYAEHVEYGTEASPEQPYMRPAVENEMPNLKTNIQRHVKKRAV